MLRYLGLKLLIENHEGISEESSCITAIPVGMVRLKKSQHCCCGHTERHLVLLWYNREILMKNGLFHLPRRASELVRQTNVIILWSCNCKFKERLEPCMTEHGLGERENSCTFVF